jgi:DnaJ-class molecular chaperone
MELKSLLNKNLYLILNVDKNSELKVIKSSFYALSKKLHPDVNHNIRENVLFQEISEAWSVLGDDSLKSEYDKKSKFGKDYNEIEELFKIDLEYNHKETERIYNETKNREVLDIIIKINKDDFDGSIEYARYVLCKECKGSGKDTSTKLAIKNDKGEIRYFEADDGCDYCEGTGKSWTGQDCGYCNGQGKVGINPCKTCNGERRILGKQKLNNVKLSGEETKVESMGHLSYYDRGKCGNLILKTNI